MFHLVEILNKFHFLLKPHHFLCQTLGVIEVDFRGRKLKIGGDRTFDDWEITVLVDGEFNTRDAFEAWSNSINNHVSNIGEPNADAYMAQWEVSQLDRAGEIIKTYKLFGLWPVSIGSIELSSDAADSLEEFPVTLSLESWTSNTTT